MHDYGHRITRLSKALQENELDWCALLPGADFAYHTGVFHFVDLLTTIAFFPSFRLSAGAKPLLILPAFERYTTELAMPYEANFVAYERDEISYAAAFRQAAERLHLNDKRIGISGLNMRYQELHLLEAAAPNATVVAADHLLSEARLIKTESEVAELRKAAQITEQALAATIKQLKPGQTEKEIRNMLDIEMMHAGAEGRGFDSIIVSGPRTALQHPLPSDRCTEPGDCIIFDIGARWAGYTADITRTVILAPMSSKVKEIFNIVKSANAAARSAAVSGAEAGAVDQAARNVIAEAGYGQFFTHGTGHGLGLDVHEPPRIAMGEKTILQPGMVFTIEPGIYLERAFGVRIEDDIAITATRNQCLTSFSRDPIVI